jgi:hypothetical protein
VNALVVGKVTAIWFFAEGKNMDLIAEAQPVLRQQIHNLFGSASSEP